MTESLGASGPSGRPFHRVQFTDDAVADLHSIRERAAPVLASVFTALKRLDRGDLAPTPLRDFGKTGDLADCGKIVVETDGYPEYRIVVRRRDDGYEVDLVVAVDERAGDLAYLLAGLRLGRIPDPVRRADAARRIARLRSRRSR